MFVGEFPTMDEPEGEENPTFDLDYSFSKMNFSANKEASEVSHEFLMHKLLTKKILFCHVVVIFGA